MLEYEPIFKSQDSKTKVFEILISYCIFFYNIIFTMNIPIKFHD